MASTMTEQSGANRVGSLSPSRFSFTSRGRSYDDGLAVNRKSPLKDVFRKRQGKSSSLHSSFQSSLFTKTPTPTKSPSSSPNEGKDNALSSQDPAMANQLLKSAQKTTSAGDLGQKARRCPQKAYRISPKPARRQSTSSRSRQLCEPQAFCPEELETPPLLSLPEGLVGKIWQPRPSPGWRIETKPRDPELCIPTALPAYSATLHSPLTTKHSRVVYVEAENRPRHGEDASECLMLGFVAGGDRVLKMPGLERWSIGVQCFGGTLCLNGRFADTMMTRGFKPGQRIGMGLTFAVGDHGGRQTQDNVGTGVTSSSIVVGVFVTSDGETIWSRKMHELLKRHEGLSDQGWDGRHDLYAAVGTTGEANVDILLERKDWKYVEQDE